MNDARRNTQLVEGNGYDQYRCSSPQSIEHRVLTAVSDAYVCAGKHLALRHEIRDPRRIDAGCLRRVEASAVSDEKLRI